MKRPYFLLGLSLIFWGYLSNNLLISLILAFVLEFANFTKQRFDFSNETAVKISDLNFFIFIASFVMIYLNEDRYKILKTLAKNLPLIFIILILYQMYSKNNSIIIGLRIARKKAVFKTLNIFHTYIFLCIFSAASLNIRNNSFYLILFILIFWTFFSLRNKRYSIKTYIFAGIFIFTTGFLGQNLLKIGYDIFDNKMTEVWERIFSNLDNNPFKTSTGIGSIGKLKLSGKILFRINLGKSNKNPNLMKENSYDLFIAPNWHKKRRDFIYTENLELANKGFNSFFSINIIQYLNKNKGFLIFPYGAFKINNLAVNLLEKDPTNTFRVTNEKNQIEYEVLYNKNILPNDLPNELDLNVPDQEKEVLFKLINDFSLNKKTDMEKVKAVSNFFRQNFKYTMISKKTDINKSQFEDFLLKRRAGHCEYFASSTVLLLRALEIPSRYVVGYSIQEKSSFDENTYIIRQRHAHSWAEAFINNRWIPIDNTPAIWLDLAEKDNSIIEPIFDLFEYLKYNFYNLREKKEEMFNLYLLFFMIILIFILVLKIYLRERKKSIEKNQVNSIKKTYFDKIETKFYLIESLFLKFNIKRMEFETFSIWIDRIEKILNERKDSQSKNLINDDLREILKNYNKIRFNNYDISENEVIEFDKSIEEYLESIKSYEIF